MAESPEMLVTLSWFARIVDASRETVRTRIQRANVEWAGTRAGNPVYRVADLIRTWTAPDVIALDQLTEFQRRAHYQAELLKLSLERERGELIPRIEVEQELARVAKIVTQELEVLPAVLEREAKLSRSMVDRVSELAAGLCRQIDQALEDSTLAITAASAGALP